MKLIYRGSKMFDDIEYYEKMIDAAYSAELPEAKIYICGAKKDVEIRLYPKEYRIHDCIIVRGVRKYIKWLDVKDINLYKCKRMSYLKGGKWLVFPTDIEGNITLVRKSVTLCDMEENINDVRELLSKAESEFGSIHTVLR